MSGEPAWPAAFLVGGDGPLSAELANLKGQMVAVEQASIQKNCGIQFQRNAAGAEGAIAPVVAVEPPPVSKQASAPQRTKGKQTRPATATAPAAAPVIIAEPPRPTLSEADRAMSQRN